MSNSEDVSLFDQGVDAWNTVVERRLYGDQPDRRDTLYKADLSREPLGRRATRRWADARPGGATLDTLICYPRAEFSFCDLRGADFKVPEIGYDLRAANFTWANLQEEDLSGADLQEARFGGANLRGAVLRGARLDGARFRDADLTATSPWRARLFEEGRPRYAVTGPDNPALGSVSDLIAVCSNLQQQNAGSSLRFYFRGEVRSWKLRPSVMRTLRLRNAEGRMLTELMTRRPHEFSHVRLAFDQWVLAQHHGLKTRMLDVTRNPLVALFFACEQTACTQADGRLHVFAVPPSLVKPFNSDSVSVVANFAKLSFAAAQSRKLSFVPRAYSTRRS